jgi:hypothetical protein
MLKRQLLIHTCLLLGLGVAMWILYSQVLIVRSVECLTQAHEPCQEPIQADLETALLHKPLISLNIADELTEFSQKHHQKVVETSKKIPHHLSVRLTSHTVRYVTDFGGVSWGVDELGKVVQLPSTEGLPQVQFTQLSPVEGQIPPLQHTPILTTIDWFSREHLPLTPLKVDASGSLSFNLPPYSIQTDLNHNPLGLEQLSAILKTLKSEPVDPRLNEIDVRFDHPIIRTTASSSGQVQSGQ